MSNKQSKKPMIDEFHHIIKNGEYQKVVAFLHMYKDGNIAILKKELNTAYNYWIDYQEIPPEIEEWENKNESATAKQSKVIALFAFGLLTPSEYYNKWTNILYDAINYFADDYFNYRHLFDEIKLIKPTALINITYERAIANDYANINYWVLQELRQYGLIDYHPEIFAKALARTRSCNTSLWQNGDIHDYIEKFINHPLLESKDIKAIFDYDTGIENHKLWNTNQNIHHINGYSDDKNKYINTNGGIWIILIDKFIQKDILDRNWVLKKCINIQNSIYNTNAKKFYKNLLQYLNPSHDEYLAIQDELFAVLNHDDKSIINFILNTIKPLIDDKKFDTKIYLNSLSSVMININFKTSIKQLLSQFDKFLKKENSLIFDIYPLLLSALIVNDISTQEKSAKLLIKYSNKEILTDDVLDMIKEHISSIYDTFTPDIKTLLSPFLLNVSLQAQTQTEKQPQNNHQKSNNSDDLQCNQYHKKSRDYFNKDNEIKLYQDFNDLLFSAGQLQHSHDYVALDVFMASWLYLRHDVGFPENCDKQIKALHKQLEKNNWTGQVLSTFEQCFIHKAIIPELEFTYQFTLRNNRVLCIWYELIYAFLYLDEIGSPLPLLSTPTHYPSYIAPVILVERIIAYQNANIPINLTDLAVAISRTPRVNIEVADDKLDEIADKAIVFVLKLAFGLLDPINKNLPDELIPLIEKHEIENQKKYIQVPSMQKKKQLLDEYEDNVYQGFRGILETIINTHYPNAIFDHTQGSEYDTIIYNHQYNENNIIDNYHIITQENQKQENRYIDEYPAVILFKSPYYINSTHTANIYRQCDYISEDSINVDRWHVMVDMSAMILARHFTPLNQMMNDKHSYNYAFAIADYIKKDSMVMLDYISRNDYNINAYTQCILVNCLFSADKSMRIAVVDSIAHLSEQGAINTNIIAKHLILMTIYKVAAFNRLNDSLALWQQYDGIAQVVLCDIFNQFILEFDPSKETLPTQFKKFLEIYYQLLAKLNQSADINIQQKLNHYVKISASIKPIVNKISQL